MSFEVCRTVPRAMKMPETQVHRKNRRAQCLFVRQGSLTVGHKTAEDLAKAVEADPHTSPRALFLDSIPLRRDQSEAEAHVSGLLGQEHDQHTRSDGCLKQT